MVDTCRRVGVLEWNPYGVKKGESKHLECNYLRKCMQAMRINAIAIAILLLRRKKKENMATLGKSTKRQGNRPLS